MWIRTGRPPKFNPDDIREEAERRMADIVRNQLNYLGSTDFGRVLIDKKEIADYAGRDPSTVKKWLAVDNLGNEGKAWTSSLGIVPLLFDPIEGQFCRPLDFPRKNYPYHAIEITTEKLWDQYEQSRAEAAVEYQKEEGGKQGEHGADDPKPGKGPRGRPRKRKEVAGTIDGRPVTKVNTARR
jgi:hypothetical protein